MCYFLLRRRIEFVNQATCSLPTFLYVTSAIEERWRLHRAEVFVGDIVIYQRQEKRKSFFKIDGKYSAWPWTVVDRWLELYNLSGSSENYYSCCFLLFYTLQAKAIPRCQPKPEFILYLRSENLIQTLNQSFDCFLCSKLAISYWQITSNV